MIFNSHSALEGQHALLSASKPSWLNYDLEKLTRYFHTQQQAALGTRLHAFAHQSILLKRRAPRNNDAVNMYINDGISYRMVSEQLLFYSINCFGTADTISFSEKTQTLRISDLKTGVTPATFKQLVIYAALFCLEYDHKPFDIRIELRIYQNDEVRIYEPEPEEVARAMATIIEFDNHIETNLREAGL